MSAPTAIPALASRAWGADKAAAADTATATAAAAPAAVPTAAAASRSKRPLGGGAHQHDHEHEHGRRVHPRLDGPSVNANGGGDAHAAAAGASSHAPARGQSSPSAAGRLHRHALESIFAFLDLGELASALRVSRDWLAAVGSMRRMETEIIWPPVPVGAIARSLMGRHVGQLGGKNSQMQLRAADLSLIADRMAHLRELHCELSLSPPTVPLAFSAGLRLVDIRLSGPADWGAADISAIFAAIGHLPLLEDFTIRSPPNRTAQISFAPLAALPRLRSFTFWPDELSDAQVDQLRALTQLRKLSVNMPTDVLRRLLRQPHSLQWQQMRLPSPLDDEAAALLPQLPTLTAIDVGIGCERFEWLRQLPNLTDVCLWLGTVTDEGRTAALLAALQHCVNIEILTLGCCIDLTAAHLADLLPRLPQLRKLTLHSLRIDSLAFLSQPPLTSRLSHLELKYCHFLPPAELRHVHALRGLTTLSLKESFDAPLEQDDQALLMPPSAALPLLTAFTYSRADDDSDSDDDDGDDDDDDDSDDADGDSDEKEDGELDPEEDDDVDENE